MYKLSFLRCRQCVDETDVSKRCLCLEGRCLNVLKVQVPGDLTQLSSILAIVTGLNQCTQFAFSVGATCLFDT